MYYGQWEGVHRMTIGGPRLKKVGNRWSSSIGSTLTIDTKIHPIEGMQLYMNISKALYVLRIN